MEAADKAWASSDGKRIHILELQMALLKGFLKANRDVLGVETRGDFRHNATIFLVNSDLAADHVAKQLAIFGDGHGGFVAAAFDC